MHARTLLLAIPAAALLAGCASAGSTGATPSDSALASTAQQVAQPAASPSPTGICTTHACIAGDLDRGLVGGVAVDESVATKVTCSKSSVVFHKAADTYSASCTVDYSDGTHAYGTGNLLVKQQKVTFSAGG
jgi:hypothetical protein